MQSLDANNKLFTPITIGQLKLSGRVIKSAMVETLCTKEGFVTPDLIEHYQQIARGGTPLIITGAANYNLYGRGVPYQLSVDDDDKIPGLKNLTQSVHELGGKIMAQIYHTSRQALPNPVGRSDAQAPSAVYEPSLGVSPREITLSEIKQNIKEFSEAALRCKNSGFDGVQIHAAHGYLISGFLTPHTNRRKDQYGGSFENRMRFLLEVYKATREKVGESFPLILKLNGSDDLPFRKGLKTQELIKIALRMEEAGINAVEITAGHYESGTTFSRGHWKGFTKTMLTHGLGPSLAWGRRVGMGLTAPLVDWYFNKISKFKEAFNLDYAKQFTQALTVPVICVGGFVNKETMSQALIQGDCDMVAVARGFIADPYLYRNLKENIQGPKCNYCNACFARPGVKPLTCYESTVSKQREDMLNKPFYKEAAHS
jgi:2,4-dienoyl-CoA reductase-like NADH-dependent reductase (Old Yellow Enzyme family)